KSARLLRREGFAAADGKTFAVAAALSNAGVFRAGAMLVGSHAYGVLLNRLGIRAAAYQTEDVDIARGQHLELGDLPLGGFLDVLRTTGIHFLPIPQLDHHTPSTSFKEKGSTSRFRVDLLVPSRDASFPVVQVPELKAHATGVPGLRYLLAESQEAALL